MRESRTYGSVRAKAEWLSYSTTLNTMVEADLPRRLQTHS